MFAFLLKSISICISYTTQVPRQNNLGYGNFVNKSIQKELVSDYPYLKHTNKREFEDN